MTTSSFDAVMDAWYTTFEYIYFKSLYSKVHFSSQIQGAVTNLFCGRSGRSSGRGLVNSMKLVGTIGIHVAGLSG